MKKFISVLLCALMLVSCLSLTAFAENIIYGDSDDELMYECPKDEIWETGNSYVIKAGSTFVVPSGKTLNVPLNSTLTVEEGAHFVVNGQLNVAGEMFVHGKLTGTNITGTGNVKCEVRFPSIADENSNLDEHIEVRYFIGTEDDYSDINIDIQKDYTAVYDDGQKLMVDYNKYIFIRVILKEAAGEDKFDDKQYPVFHNGTKVTFVQNACPVLVTTSGDISYGSWPQDESRLYNTYTVTLPEGEGYTVYGRNGEYGKVTLKYGQSFSFRIELEEEFDQSAYEVYVYNGSGWTNLEKDDLLEGIEPAVPDAEGYYTINKITGDYTIYVQGVMSNEVLGIFEQVFTILKQVWEAVMNVFQELFGSGIFDGLLGKA